MYVVYSDPRAYYVAGCALALCITSALPYEVCSRDSRTSQRTHCEFNTGLFWQNKEQRTVLFSRPLDENFVTNLVICECKTSW
jgi:hypothetical protein